MEEKQSSNPKWDWIPCNYNLKTEINKKMTAWNLQPAIVLTNPNEDGADPHVKLYIDTEKSLQYSDELGWNWHKSWNLPNISVRLEIKDAQTGEALLAPKNLYTQIFAVKAVIDQPDNFHLVDVGIRGTSKLEMVNGQAFFTAIKFFSTSYNNEGVKFHLVLCIYIQSEEDDICPKILNATISPPIFVDSRKSARDQNVILEKKMTSFVEPFQPDNLDKSYIKRENKKKSDTEIQINNDAEGLFNYLTAPNIRHKVKHPLFLCLKFSSSVKLYYNKEQQDTEEPILQSLQRNITKEHYTQSMATNQNSVKPEEKKYLLFFQESSDTNKNKKIIEAIDPLQCPSLGIVYQQSQIPSNFVNICDESNPESINEMIQNYKKSFSNLISIVKMIKSQVLPFANFEESNEDSDNEESDEDKSQDGEPTKKVKPNPVQEKNLEENNKTSPTKNAENSKQNNTTEKSNSNLQQNGVAAAPEANSQAQKTQEDKDKQPNASQQINQQQQLQQQQQQALQSKLLQQQQQQQIPGLKPGAQAQPQQQQQGAAAQQANPQFKGLTQQQLLLMQQQQQQGKHTETEKDSQVIKSSQQNSADASLQQQQPGQSGQQIQQPGMMAGGVQNPIMNQNLPQGMNPQQQMLGQNGMGFQQGVLPQQQVQNLQNLQAQIKMDDQSQQQQQQLQWIKQQQEQQSQQQQQQLLLMQQQNQFMQNPAGGASGYPMQQQFGMPYGAQAGQNQHMGMFMQPNAQMMQNQAYPQGYMPGQQQMMGQNGMMQGQQQIPGMMYGQQPQFQQQLPFQQQQQLMQQQPQQQQLLQQQRVQQLQMQNQQFKGQQPAGGQAMMGGIQGGQMHMGYPQGMQPGAAGGMMQLPDQMIHKNDETQK